MDFQSFDITEMEGDARALSQIPGDWIQQSVNCEPTYLAQADLCHRQKLIDYWRPCDAPEVHPTGFDFV